MEAAGADPGISPPTSRRTVVFHGGRAGQAALTWSQHGIWRLQREIWPEHHYFNFGRLLPVPSEPGCTLAGVESALRELIEACEAFRTTVHRIADGGLVQRVAASGEYPLDVHEVVDTDPAAAAERLAYEYKGYAFEDDEWPLRMAVVTREHVPVYVLFMASHLAVDRWGMDLAYAAFARRLSGRTASIGQGGDRPLQPVDQAAVEASAAGERAAARAVGYWRRVLYGIPQTLFTGQRHPVRSLWCPTGEVTSAAAARAAAILADRHGGSDSGAVLAVTAAMLSTLAGSSTVAMRLFAANRHSGGLRGMVGTCVQPGLYTLDLADLSMHELIARSWQSALTAYRYARYPVELIEAVIGEVNHSRGVHTDLLCHFHDATGPAVRREPLDAAVLEAARAASVFRRGAILGAHQKFLLELAGSPGAELRVRVVGDRRFLSPAQVELFARGVETTLIEAVRRDFGLAEMAGLTGVEPWDRRPGLRRVDGCAIELDEVDRLLCEVPGVVTAHSSVDDDRGGLLVARVVVRDAGLDDKRLHAAVMRLLPGRPTAMAPQYYLLHLSSEDGPGLAPQEIPGLQCHAEGSGRRERAF